MKINAKFFNELCTEELFEIYKLRTSVFVVEQKCPYQEVDDLDKVACHVFSTDDSGISAYLRILPKGSVSEYISIGRVIARERRKGLGTMILNEGINTAIDKFNADVIFIEAQSYAKEFYEKIGFVQVSEEFLLDNIPHIKMILKLK